MGLDIWGRLRMASLSDLCATRLIRRPYHIGRRTAFAILLAIVGAINVPGAGLAAGEPVIVAFGNSLTAGYGLSNGDSFPVRLETALRGVGIRARVVNAGVSGDTTAGGRARLAWALGDEPDIVIVELGANDALRGIDPEETYRNLDAILGELRKKGVRVLLAGMMAPPNLGDRYAQAFNAIYPALAEKHGVPLYPFFLDGVAADPSLNQHDGIHPNAQGVSVIVSRILPYVERMIAAR